MIKITLVSAAIAAVFAAWAGAAHAAPSASPRQAALAAKNCFSKNGWSAQLIDGGVTVIAQGPRKPSGQRRAWYSVAFRAVPGYSSVLALNLDSRERRTATLCRSAGGPQVAPIRPRP